jgi:lysophospholipase L1-like esterase
MKLRTILGVLLMTALLALGSATAKDRANNSGEYLALGDSAVFPFLQEGGYEWEYATNFVGYADWTGLALGLTMVNASCPGETTGSYLDFYAPDNGCRYYRLLFPLHVVYDRVESTQSDFATAFLTQDRYVALVTIQLGANDLSLLEQKCKSNPQCIENGAPQVFAKAEANMQTALAQLRATGYSGPIVIVNYYSIDYTNQFVTELIVGLNQAITAPAPAYGAVVADVFSAFKGAAMAGRARGDTCRAGLLNAHNPQTQPWSCDIHASQSGHKLIAQTIEGIYQPLAGKADR